MCDAVFQKHASSFENASWLSCLFGLVHFEAAGRERKRNRLFSYFVIALAVGPVEQQPSDAQISQLQHVGHVSGESNVYPIYSPPPLSLFLVPKTNFVVPSWCATTTWLFIVRTGNFAIFAHSHAPPLLLLLRWLIIVRALSVYSDTCLLLYGANGSLIGRFFLQIYSAKCPQTSRTLRLFTAGPTWLL